MKKVWLLFLPLFWVAQPLFSQSDGPKAITPQILEKIKDTVEKQVRAFEKILSKQDITAEAIEFAIDTFRIEQILLKRMDVDYSTAGMNNTVREMESSYDRLMNKYYNKLIKMLSSDDRKILIAAQKAWLVYRDAEVKLIGTLTEPAYSGGGTMQSNIATGRYADLVVQRTIQIFQYYISVIENK
jgi:uncharacterized protein YecT (DUF1311 family)